MRVVVVGAGLGGLSAACHLVGRGHRVTVVERESRPGGRAGRIDTGGYHFDPGPTVLTMPGILADVFAAAGARMEDHLTLGALDPLYRVGFADGGEIRVRAGRDAMTEEIRSVCGPADAAAFGRFCDWLTELYELEFPHFVARDFDSPFDLARDPRPLLKLVRMGGFDRLHRKVESFFTDERLRRVFSFQSLYAGLSPFEALAIYCVITYMDTVAGVYFPEGGMYAMSTGLRDAAAAAGVEFSFDDPVARIERRPGGAVRGVRLESGARLAADAVVCNVDLPVAYRTLVGLDPPRVARKGRYSPSCVLWLAGVRGDLPTGAAHHNLHLGQEWRDAFQALVDDGRRMPDPSLLVTVPTQSDPSLAPPGRHSLYVLEPCPNLDGQVDWIAERPRLRDDLAERVAKLGYPVESDVEVLLDPLDWEAQGLERGTPFSLAHTFFQTGPFRPGTVDRRVPGLVFVGSGTVPGVGVPMVLVSGRLAADRVDELAGAVGR